MLYALGEISPQVDGRCYVAPDAAVIGDVYLGPDTSVWFGAVIRGDVERITIGRGSNIQDASVLHCDPGAPLTLDEFVTVGHKVMLHGCRVGRNSLIGISSTLLNHVHIGANSIVGANALVTEGKEFPEACVDSRIAGQGRQGTDGRRDRPAAGLRTRYIERAARYRTELRTTS